MKTRHIAGIALLLASTALVSCTKNTEPAFKVLGILPDWKGIWIAEGHESGISGLGTADSNASFKLVSPEIPWNDAGRAKMAATFSSMGKRKADGWGFPMMMDSYAPIHFVLSTDEVVIINSYHEVIQIYTDGRAHPAAEDRWPTTWGNSIGHWEGDTLVVDTVSVRDPTKYMFFAPPFSDEAHYVQRLRLAAPDRIESEITIDDPATLTKPWTTHTAYIRTPNMDRLVYDAFENDRNELDGNVFTIMPPKQ